MTANADLKPFSYSNLPAISREEVRVARQVRELATSWMRPDAVAGALGDLVGEQVRVSVRSTRPLDPAHMPFDGVGVAFAPAEAGDLSSAALVEVETALASTLVARALRQRAPRVIDTSRAAAPEVAGALAAVLHTALRRAHVGLPLRVVTAGPTATLQREISRAHASRSATAWLTVVVGADAFDARVTVPIADLQRPRAQAALSAEALERLGDAPLSLPLVVTTCLADRTMLGALARGDTFVLPRVSVAPSPDGELIGRVALVPARSELGLGADLGAGGRLMLRSGPVENHPWDVSRPSENGELMSGEPNTTLQVLEEAPVVVRIELGSVEMTAREWSELAPGDVVTLGRRLGDPAILRVGGAEVARGELVHVEGEMGVRILGPAGGER